MSKQRDFRRWQGSRHAVRDCDELYAACRRRTESLGRGSFSAAALAFKRTNSAVLEENPDDAEEDPDEAQPKDQVLTPMGGMVRSSETI